MGRARVVLICCEGKETEPRYFQTLIRIFHISQGSVKVKIAGGLGQHKRLIDECVAHRSILANRMELSIDDVETWAVCDNDNMAITYNELLAYSAKSSVKMAFSNPAFEVYLLQHFGFSASTARGGELEAILSDKIGQKYNKSDVRWLEDMVYRDPRMINSVLTGCHNISEPSNVPFTTVHKLVDRLLRLAPRVG